MPMIDVYATAGTFGDKRALPRALTQALMRWEQVPRLGCSWTTPPRSSTTLPPTPWPTHRATALGYYCPTRRKGNGTRERASLLTGEAAAVPAQAAGLRQVPGGGAVGPPMGFHKRESG
jgi:hypothetical protein